MTGLTAAALIEAIAEREWRWYWDHNGDNADVQWSEVGAEAADGWRERARAIAAVSLPLIADAIEAAPIPFTRDRERMEWGRGVQIVMAEVVRGLLEADDDRQD